MPGGSAYAQQGSSGGGSAYAQPSSGGGSVYAGGSSSTAPAPKKKPGGLFHWLGQKAELAGHDLKSIPAGIVQTAKTVGAAEIHGVEHGDVNPLENLVRDKATRALGKNIVKQTVTTVEHPLRDPFATLLTVAPGFGAAGKVAEAGRVAKAGGDLADVGKALVTKPPVRPRLISVGDTQVPLQPSKNPAVRAVQALHDKVIQHALDTNPEGRVAAYGAKRVAGSIAETARYQQRLREVPANALESDAKRLGRQEKVPRKLQQAALRLTSEQSTPLEAARFHAAQAEKGIGVAANRKLADVYQQVHDLGLLTTDEHGGVIVNAEKYPHLAHVDAQVAAGQHQVDQILAKHGIMDESQLAERINGPARIRAGARYEPPTPGKLGVPSPSLLRQRAEVDRLQRRYDALEQRGQRGGYVETSRPRTEVEAASRLAQLEKRHNEFRQQVYSKMFGDQKLTADERAEQAYRNIVNGRIRRSQSGRTRAGGLSGSVGKFRGMRELPTVQSERQAMVDQHIEDSLNKLGDHPSAVRFRREQAEIDRLRSALETRPEEAFGGPRIARTADELGTVATAELRRTNPHLERIGGALSVAKERLQQLEQAAARRQKPTGVVTAGQTFAHRVATAPQQLIDEYVRRFGNEVNTDRARELSPDYAASRESRAALSAEVHEPASAIAKNVYAHLLKQPAARDETVTFTAGGTGAGKSVSLSDAERAHSDIIYDTNLNNYSSSVKKIEQALASGRNVEIHYVYRPPAQALEGMLHRAHRMGRVVPLAEHIKTHVESNATIARLAAKYENNPRVAFRFIDNSGGKGQARDVSLANIPRLVHNEVANEVRNAYHQEHAAGRVEGFIHEALARHPAASGEAFPREVAERGSAAGPPDVLSAAARPGRGFVSYRTVEPKASRSSAAASQGPVVGVAKPFVNKTPITYHGLEHGQVPDNTSRLVASHMRQAYRYVNTDAFRRQVLATGSEVRRTSRDVLVRNPDEVAGKIPAEVQEALGRANLTVDELAGHQEAFRSFMQQIIPGLADRFSLDRAQPIGLKAPDGYRWVDRNILGDLARTAVGPRGRIARTADNINSAVTAATVYFKIGHVGTRVLTNAATNIIQGSATPLQVAKSVKLWDALGREDRLRALAAAGQHGFAAMPHEGVSVAARVAGKGANWWAKHADAPFRFNSIAYEARKAGYGTPAKFQQLLGHLENPDGLSRAEFAKVDGIAKRANREGIAYDRLSENERRFIARGIWFYPWVKGTVGFLGNTILEHPFKTGVIGAAGVEGRTTQQRELGDVPSYEGGLFRLGGNVSHPTVADFSTFSPFATPADVIETAGRPKSIGGMLNPVLGATNSLINGVDAFGTPTKTPYTSAIQQLVSPTPEAQIITAYLQRHQDQSKRMFHKTVLNQVARSLIGPGQPRRVNLAALHSAAARERSGR